VIFANTLCFGFFKLGKRDFIFVQTGKITQSSLIANFYIKLRTNDYGVQENPERPES